MAAKPKAPTRTAFRATYGPISSRCRFPVSGSRLSDIAEGNIQDRILRPILVVEVPPLVRLDGKTVAFHDGTEQIAFRARFGWAAAVVGVGAPGHLVVAARHLDRSAQRTVVHREVDGA